MPTQRLKGQRLKEPLSVTHPQLAAEWHPTKNGDLCSDDVTAGSHRKVWWSCLQNHDWQAIVSNRARLGRGCPFCAGRYADDSHNLAFTHPALASDWHPTKNGTQTPRDVLAGSNKEVWWKCEAGHEWSATPNARSSGIGCPFCSLRRVDDSNCLATTHPSLAAEWHPTRNEGLTPGEITAKSSQKVWWKCSKSVHHEWQASINARVAGSFCPFCPRRRPRPGNSLATDRPELAVEWHPTKNGDLRPEDVTKGSPR